MVSSTELLKKYDVPVPRYTSYPTVPYWEEAPTQEEWFTSIERVMANDKSSWGMYIHMPFCETLCTFCGCNTSITRDHSKEDGYVQLLLKEWSLYRDRILELKRRPIRQLHLGGGSPTFFSPQNLDMIIRPILEDCNVEKNNFEGSIEVDPRRTRKEQLEVLYGLGFRRVSMGVQDFDPEVQRLVNRNQPYEVTRDLTQTARAIGYEGVNYDLIYGLPKQSLLSFERTAKMTVELRPDRIALYSLAKVPWIKPQQRLFKDEDLPEGQDKRNLYELARQILLDAGYIEIGMDHFALPTDALTKSFYEKTMHRNFMGYTEWRTDLLLSLGVSSISETPDMFHQNEKVLPVYEKRVLSREIPTHRGHKLTEEDRHQREQILKFMTQNQLEFTSEKQIEDVREFLTPMMQDELVYFDGKTLKLTEKGKPFLRNACVALDLRLRRNAPQTKIFSQSL